MKVITWNVNGIRARQSEVVDLLAEERPDFVCLQEIKAPPEKVPALLVAPEDYWSCWHGSGGYSGVALLIRRSFVASQPVFAHPAFDFECRIVAADIDGMVVASVYVPNGGKDYEAKVRFLDALSTWAVDVEARGMTVVVCGDVNVAREDRDVHPKERKAGQIGTRPDERSLVQKMLVGGLVDVGRTLDPANDELFTFWPPWRQRRPRNIGWRIDYVLAGERLAARARTSESRRTFGTSDHAPVIVTFDDGRPPFEVSS